MNYKDFIRWKFDRETSQYLIFCLLIVAFIFLTPQSWFDTGSPLKSHSGSEPPPHGEHQKPVASKIILAVGDNLKTQMSQSQIESEIRTLTGRTDTEVLNVQPKLDTSGKIVAYEVDIR